MPRSYNRIDAFRCFFINENTHDKGWYVPSIYLMSESRYRTELLTIQLILDQIRIVEQDNNFSMFLYIHICIHHPLLYTNWYKMQNVWHDTKKETVISNNIFFSFSRCVKSGNCFSSKIDRWPWQFTTLQARHIALSAVLS